MLTLRFPILPLSAAALALALGAQAQAASSPGAVFLRLDVGARSAAMGGAFSAIAEGPEGMWVNPAAVGINKGKKAMVMHNDYISDISQEYVGYMHETQGKNRGNWGFSYMALDLGSQAGFNALNVATGNFTPTDSVMSLGYGRKLNKRSAAGVTLKYVKSEIANFSDTTFALDAGLLYKLPNQPLRLSAVVQNLGQGLEVGNGSDSLPTLIRLGAAYKLPQTEWLWALEGEFAKGDDPVWKLGTEYGLTKMVRLRAGYNNGSDLDNGFSYGVGILQTRYQFNYAYIPFGVLGNTHRFALDLNW